MGWLKRVLGRSPRDPATAPPTPPATAPTFAQLAPSMLGLLQRRVLVAHNATFDLAFLSGELDRAGWAWPSDVPSLCTLKESMYFQPHLDRRRLADCCWAAGVTLTDLISSQKEQRLLELSAGLAPLPQGWALGEPLRVGQRVVFTGCRTRMGTGQRLQRRNPRPHPRRRVGRLRGGARAGF